MVLKANTPISNTVTVNLATYNAYRKIAQKYIRTKKSSHLTPDVIDAIHAMVRHGGIVAKNGGRDLLKLTDNQRKLLIENYFKSWAKEDIPAWVTDKRNPLRTRKGVKSRSF
jgi:hypothetical protein